MSAGGGTPGRRAVLALKITPNAGRDGCAGLMEDAVTWKIRLAAPAVDGKANAALTAWLARVLGVKKHAVSLVAGLSSRQKRVAVEGLDQDEATARMAVEARDC